MLSLFAIRIVLPASIAKKLAFKPANPEIAEITISTDGS